MKKTQKTFAFHWGTGVIAEEAQVSGQHHLSTFQLLEYTEGQAAGEVSLRFCHYSYEGRFSRSPLMMSTEDIDMMREALKETPVLRGLLLRLVED